MLCMEKEDSETKFIKIQADLDAFIVLNVVIVDLDTTEGKELYLLVTGGCFHLNVHDFSD